MYVINSRGMEFCPLASGSKGNCLYLKTQGIQVLIDAGLSAKATAERLHLLGVRLEDIQAILITHEHTDHIRGLPNIAGKLGIPVYANNDTARAILESTRVKLPFHLFATGETFSLADLEIHPFSIQHDTFDPVAFTIQAEGKKIGICTDLGCATTLVRTHLENCNCLFLEANHQPSMVHASNRPMVYKQRVLSRQGHLSNEECAMLISQIIHPQLDQIYLAHLSSECNHPDLAYAIVRSKIEESIALAIAWQDKISKKWEG